jgi:GTP-binding protein
MISDQATITLTAGKGGRGSNATVASKRRGANGGNGGAIYLVGDKDINDLYRYVLVDHYAAANGSNAERGNKDGKDGKDLYLHVPLVTVVEFANGKKYEIKKDKEEVRMIEGGRGGIGTVLTPGTSRKYDPEAKGIDLGKFGTVETVKLTFQLVADVIFFGYPNAGKSSMLNELSHSQVKVAPYAFTTLDPQMGIMDGIKLMDLPGLIDGTSEGKGLGMKFLKHTVYSKLIAHFVSMENEDPWATYKLLRKEIKNISSDLYSRPEIVVLAKVDECTPEKLAKVSKQFSSHKIRFVTTSILIDESIIELKELIKKALAELS